MLWDILNLSLDFGVNRGRGKGERLSRLDDDREKLIIDPQKEERFRGAHATSRQRLDVGRVRWLQENVCEREYDQFMTVQARASSCQTISKHFNLFVSLSVIYGSVIMHGWGLQLLYQKYKSSWNMCAHRVYMLPMRDKLTLCSHIIDMLFLKLHFPWVVLLCHSDQFM